MFASLTSNFPYFDIDFGSELPFFCAVKLSAPFVDFQFHRPKQISILSYRTLSKIISSKICRSLPSSESRIFKKTDEIDSFVGKSGACAQQCRVEQPPFLLLSENGYFFSFELTAAFALRESV